jgi:hypothetical protein
LTDRRIEYRSVANKQHVQWAHMPSGLILANSNDDLDRVLDAVAGISDGGRHLGEREGMCLDNLRIEGFCAISAAARWVALLPSPRMPNT